MIEDKFGIVLILPDKPDASCRPLALCKHYIVERTFVYVAYDGQAYNWIKLIGVQEHWHEDRFELVKRGSTFSLDAEF